MAEIKLTANDPEPPPATVVRDDTGCRWCRERGRVPCGWISEHDSAGADPESWAKVAGNYGPATVLRLPDGVETWPPKPKESAPADLAAQIRARLDGWAPPEPWLAQFAEDEPRTPDELAAVADELSRAIEAGAFAGPVLVLPPSPRFYPGFEQLRAAPLAVLDLQHLYQKFGPVSLPEGVEGRIALAKYEAYHEVLSLAATRIADALGIEVDHG